MNGGKLTYSELLAKCNKLELDLKELRVAMKQADRAMVGYGVERWVSIPLPNKQKEQIKDDLLDYCLDRWHNDANSRLRRRELSEGRFEDVVQSPLAEFRFLLIRWSPAGVENIWGLEPA